MQLVANRDLIITCVTPLLNSALLSILPSCRRSPISGCASRETPRFLRVHPWLLRIHNSRCPRGARLQRRLERRDVKQTIYRGKDAKGKLTVQRCFCPAEMQLKHSPERGAGCRSPSPRSFPHAFFMFLVTAPTLSLVEFLLSIQKSSNPGVKKKK